MAAFTNDGSVNYGSRILVINSVSYVADNFTVTDPSKVIEQSDEIDEPSGQVAYSTFMTASAQLQIPTGGDYPAKGETCTTSVAGTSTTFFVFDLNLPESKDAEKKINVTLRRQYN